MNTKAIREFNKCSMKDKLNFDAWHRPGVNIIKGERQRLAQKRKVVVKKTRENLTGTELYRANIPTCRFYFWTSWPANDMRSMTSKQYKLYCHKKRLEVYEGKAVQSDWDKRLLWGVK